jgi:hypothetical protein
LLLQQLQSPFSRDHPIQGPKKQLNRAYPAETSERTEAAHKSNDGGAIKKIRFLSKKEMVNPEMTHIPKTNPFLSQKEPPLK